MKLKEKEIVVERSGDIVESMFGISGKDSAHILNILRDKLYSNKILAVIREYCTNAQDAHAEVGKNDIPIEVTLPSALDMSFKVRDYGTGLSENDIRNIYVMYGASTKRNTNNAIGQLGLGGKSAFAYSDKFDIISWFGGEKKTYYAYIDETKCGKIALLNTEISDEPEGIQINVPVRDNDDFKFYNEAKDLLKFFDPQPELFGRPAVLEEFKYIYQEELLNGANFGLVKLSETNYYYRTPDSYVIMGGVSYPVNKDLLYDELRPLFDCVMHLRVNIGDVDIAANRESLEYTEDTIDILNKYFLQISNTIKKFVSNKINDALTFKEANIVYNKLIKTNNFIKNIVSNNAIWKDKDVTGFVLENNWSHKGNIWPRTNIYNIYRPKERGEGFSWTKSGHSIRASEDLIIFIKDIENNRSWKTIMSRYMNYHNINSKNVCVLDWQVEEREIIELKPGLYVQARQHVYTKRELKDYNILKISDCKIKLPLNKIKSTYKRSTNNSNSAGNIFTLKSNPSCDRQCKSGDWNKATNIPSGTKYYVELDAFFIRIPTSIHRLYMNDFTNIITTANKIGFTPVKIYGVKTKHIPKLDKTWKCYTTELKGRILSSSLVANIVNKQAYAEISPQVKALVAHRKVFPFKTTARKLLNITARLSKSDNIHYSSYSFSACSRLLDIQDVITEKKSKYNIREVTQKAKEKYKLTHLTNVFPGQDSYNRRQWYDSEIKTKELIPHIVEYIKIAEKI